MGRAERDGELFARAYNNPKHSKQDWEDLYKGFNAAVDWPTCSFYKELMKAYPDAKVILTTRSAESWYRSM